MGSEESKRSDSALSFGASNQISKSRRRFRPLPLSGGPLPLLIGTGLRLFLRPAQPQYSNSLLDWLLLEVAARVVFHPSATDFGHELQFTTKGGIPFRAHCGERASVFCGLRNRKMQEQQMLCCNNNCLQNDLNLASKYTLVCLK